MNETDRRFWPFKPRTSIAWTILMLIGLLLIVVILRTTISWPSEKSETAVLVGVLLLSLLPILFSLIDVIIERGAVIEYGGVKIDFYAIARTLDLHFRNRGSDQPLRDPLAYLQVFGQELGEIFRSEPT